MRNCYAEAMSLSIPRCVYLFSQSRSENGYDDKFRIVPQHKVHHEASFVKIYILDKTTAMSQHDERGDEGYPGLPSNLYTLLKETGTHLA